MRVFQLSTSADLCRCVAQHQPGQPFRCIHAKPLADHAAHRETAEAAMFNPQAIEQRHDIAPELLNAVGAGRNRRLAVAALVISQNSEVLGKFGICGSHIVRLVPRPFESSRTGLSLAPSQR